MTPGWGQFLPHDCNLNNLGKGLLDEATYQILKAYVSHKMIFPYMGLRKISDPLGGAIFDPVAFSCFGRGLLDEATFEISKAWAICKTSE